MTWQAGSAPRAFGGSAEEDSPDPPLDPVLGAAARPEETSGAVGLPRFRGARVSLSLLGLVTAVMLATIAFSPYGPNDVELVGRLQPMSFRHPMGTDQFGRDVLTRVAHGGLLSLTVAFASLFASFVLGVLVGVVAAWRGGLLATLLLTINDTLVIIPMILVMLTFVAAFGTGSLTLMLGMIALGWVVFARLAYQLATRSLSSGYVESTVAVGAGSGRIIFRHVWPNLAKPLITYMVLRLPSKLLAFSGLSFLGLGPRPPQAEWGVMIAEGRSLADRNPWLLLGPAGMIVLVSVLVASLGDAGTDWDEVNA